MTQVGRLHVLTDTSIQSRYPVDRLAQFAIEGGAEVIQYREKRMDLDREREVESILKVIDGHDIELIINDDFNLAQKYGLGVHLGKEDGSPEVARRALGRSVTMGYTVHSVAEARRIELQHVNYCGVGPLNSSRHIRKHRPPLGYIGIHAIRKELAVPVIAIGDVRVDDIVPLMDAGVHGVAILGSFVLADDPIDVLQRYRIALEDRKLEQIEGVPLEAERGASSP